MPGVADFIAGGNLEQLMEQSRQEGLKRETGPALSPEAQQELARLIQSPQMAQIFQLAQLGMRAAQGLPAEIVQQLMAPNPGVEMLQQQPAVNPGVEMLQDPRFGQLPF